MRRTLLLLSFAALAACARDPLIPGLPRYLREPPGHKAESTADSVLTIPPGTHTWATAVRFPDGYDWEVDTCAVEGAVWLDLYCDGMLLRSVRAGESLQPDMHRFAGGHLYADSSTDTETVLYRDGAELFRFEGREALRGFLLQEDGIHTLGQDRDGDGITYRVDGREVFRSDAGLVFGNGNALTENDGALWYGFSVKGKAGREYRLMRESELAGTVEPDGTVYDFCQMGGKAYWLQTRRGGLTLVEDGSRTSVGLKAGETVRSGRIVPGADGLYIMVQAERSGTRRTFIRLPDGSQRELADGETVGAVLSDGKDTGWIVTASDGSLRFIRKGGESLSIPRGGFLYGNDCALYADGHLFLALSGHFGEPGRLVRDSEVTEIPFNGYFTSITLE